jgi:hypothetical protein
VLVDGVAEIGNSVRKINLGDLLPQLACFRIAAPFWWEIKQGVIDACVALVTEKTEDFPAIFVAANGEFAAQLLLLHPAELCPIEMPEAGGKIMPISQGNHQVVRLELTHERLQRLSITRAKGHQKVRPDAFTGGEIAIGIKTRGCYGLTQLQ